MKRKNKEGKLFIGILVAVLALGIGYATITAIPLIINGNATAKANGTDADFDVHFGGFQSGTNYLTYTEEEGNTGSLTQTVANANKIEGTFEGKTKKVTVEVDSTDNKKANITINDLENVGDKFTVKIPVLNESNGIGAALSTNLTNNNEDYFTVSSSLDDEDIASGGSSYVNVTVTLKKVPKVEDITSTFTVELTAEPTEE